MKCSMPASLASSTTYWISGLSTMVNISFGIALVAGRTRVPRPATGKTALRIFMGYRAAFGELAGRASSRFAYGNKGGCGKRVTCPALFWGDAHPLDLFG